MMLCSGVRSADLVSARRVLDESARLGDSEESVEPQRLQQWQLDSFHIGGALFAVGVELFCRFAVVSSIAGCDISINGTRG